MHNPLVSKVTVAHNKKLHNPLVSALIAAHNEELHIANCINSLLAQSYSNLEIIVVENGISQDKTLEISKLFEKKFKNVLAFTIPGKQKGPGNAWNFGIKKAKGRIILICGADLIYGKDYVKNGVSFLLKGNHNAIVHKEEKCNNPGNLWARAFFKSRKTTDSGGLSRVFTVVKKEYISRKPFDSELGYADDQTIYRKEGTMFPGADLEVYHTNPASFRDTWEHSLWVGRSMSSTLKIVLALPILPVYSVYKTIIHLKQDFYPPFILFLPFYYSIRYLAYFKEAVKRL